MNVDSGLTGRKRAHFDRGDPMRVCDSLSLSFLTSDSFSLPVPEKGGIGAGAGLVAGPGVVSAVRRAKATGVTCDIRFV